MTSVPIVDPLDLLGRWDDADLAVVIDAVCSGATTGHRLRGRPGDARSGARSDEHPRHQVCRVCFGLPKPWTTHRPAWSSSASKARISAGVLGLSPAVEAAIPVAVRRVVDLIKEVRPCA